MPNSEEIYLKCTNDGERETECRWKSYYNYKVMLWAWMLNEIAISVGVALISHTGFYLNLIMYTSAAIFIGIPLAYSEVCLAQYTNRGVIAVWDFFPLFRPVGYGTIYLVFLKYLYIMGLASWYLQYTFYAALDPPPWFSCDDFNTTKCMVKSINVSVFQHCLEAQMLFDDDCGIETASNCFFEREIGNNNAINSIFCVFSWKSIIASSTISCILFILSLRKMKIIQFVVKILAIYISVVILVLLSVALSTSGAWYASRITIDWTKYTLESCYNTIILGFLSLGTGCGMIGFLSKDVPFRSPATMTTISSSLLSCFVTGMYSLIIFSGIKTMSYYHGEEENVVEMGISSFFLEFASTSEILIYFDQISIWGFSWFSSIFLGLLVNLWLFHTFLKSLIVDNVSFTRRHINVLNIIITFVLSVLSWPLFCSDITGAFMTAIEIIQTLSSFLLSISLYWFYGFNKHNVDITFMIGIKASYFWKIAWIFNPVIIFTMVYMKLTTIEAQPFDDVIIVQSLNINHDVLIVYVLVGIYTLIVIGGIIINLAYFFYEKNIKEAFIPTEDWGPVDNILHKSRIMFRPQIMTREFLYRQVRIHGYSTKKKTLKKCREQRSDSEESSLEDKEWSAFTSN